MYTCQKMEKIREYTRKRMREEMKDEDNKDAKRRKQKEIKDKNKIEKQLILDELKEWKERAEKWKAKAKKMGKQIEEMEERYQSLVELHDLQLVIDDEDEEKDEETEEEEEEEEKEEISEGIDERVETFLKNTKSLKTLTHLDEERYAKLAEEVQEEWRRQPGEGQRE